MSDQNNKDDQSRVPANQAVPTPEDLIRIKMGYGIGNSLPQPPPQGYIQMKNDPVFDCLHAFNVFEAHNAFTPAKLADDSPHAAVKLLPNEQYVLVRSFMPMQINASVFVRVEQLDDVSQGPSFGIVSERYSTDRNKQDFFFPPSRCATLENAWLLGPTDVGQFSGGGGGRNEIDWRTCFAGTGVIVQMMLTRDFVLELSIAVKPGQSRVYSRRLNCDRTGSFYPAVMLCGEGDRVRFVRPAEMSMSMELCKLWLVGTCHRKTCKYKHVAKSTNLFVELVKQQRWSTDTSKKEMESREKTHQERYSNAWEVFVRPEDGKPVWGDALQAQLSAVYESSTFEELATNTRTALANNNASGGDLGDFGQVLAKHGWNGTQFTNTQSGDYDHFVGTLIDDLMELSTKVSHGESGGGGDLEEATKISASSPFLDDSKRILYLQTVLQYYRRGRIQATTVAHVLTQMATWASSTETYANGCFEAIIICLQSFDPTDTHWAEIAKAESLPKIARLLYEIPKSRRCPANYRSLALQLLNKLSGSRRH